MTGPYTDYYEKLILFYKNKWYYISQHLGVL